MSKIISTYNSIDVCCPFCDFQNEIFDLEISVTIENTDIKRHCDEGVFDHTCEECGCKFEIVSQMDIFVRKLAPGEKE